MTNNPFEQNRKDNGVSDTDLLKLMDILTLHEASALIAGCSPNQVRGNWDNDEIYYYLPEYMTKTKKELEFEVLQTTKTNSHGTSYKT